VSSRSSMRWFGTSPCRAVPEGPPPSPAQHHTRRLRPSHPNLPACSWHTTNTISIVEPGAITPSGGGDHFAVFTPYYRHWVARNTRGLLKPPERISVPPIASDGLPSPDQLCSGQPSPHLPRGGETAGRRLFGDWLAGPIGDYEQAHDDLAADGTSRLSPYLHFGCISPTGALRAATKSATAGGDAFIRQLAWRDFHHQVLAARPEVATTDYRTRHDHWRCDDTAAQAWRDGRTGYPIVDAGMRQLQREGWMHNRARLITASFLTKTLYLDWRLGARHFFDLLVDADVANNQLNWQWVAGTGTDTRPNRVLNPLRQAERYDPNGDYVRRYLPELQDIPGPAVHQPWKLDRRHRARLDYPDPIIDLRDGADYFRTARDKNR
ncbi:MAG: deoxyribodipyrimidine photo-lyase, partial [Pseudonocardiales bacterium]|nr:deoxyribodipyrimidine photo-lyase [Pseudonocardiales bacterium]